MVWGGFSHLCFLFIFKQCVFDNVEFPPLPWPPGPATAAAVALEVRAAHPQAPRTALRTAQGPTAAAVALTVRATAVAGGFVCTYIHVHIYIYCKYI